MKTSNRHRAGPQLSHELHTSVTWKNDWRWGNCSSLSSTQRQLGTQHGRTQFRYKQVAASNLNGVSVTGCLHLLWQNRWLCPSVHRRKHPSTELNPTTSQPAQSNSGRGRQKVCRIPLGAVPVLLWIPTRGSSTLGGTVGHSG